LKRGDVPIRRQFHQPSALLGVAHFYWEKIMKINSKVGIMLTVALLFAGVAIANGGPQTKKQNNERKESKSKERSEKSEGREKGEAGETQQDQAALAREAKITKEQAQEVALQRAPGTVESSELEREHGKLVYSFDIRNAKGTIDEVQVSALSGKIVRVEHETAKQEADEKRKEAGKP
jgi:uncharacterized membrane protein YkoI